ncbi:hypothetical protein ACFQBN_35525 [Cohnella cellulosilytica]
MSGVAVFDTRYDFVIRMAEVGQPNLVYERISARRGAFLIFGADGAIRPKPTGER